MTDTNDDTLFVVEEIEPIMKCIPFAIQLPSSILFNENDSGIQDDNNDPNLDRKTSNVSTSTTATKKQSKQNILWDKYNSYGIVGTILYIGPKSVLIWFGWGDINSTNNATNTNNDITDITSPNTNNETAEICNDNNVQTQSLSSSKTLSVGTSKEQSMGPLVIAMPPMKYNTISTNGRGGGTSGISSKLIGNENPIVEMIIEQMSVRLSSKLRNLSLLITCSSSLIDDTPRIATEGMDTESIVYRAVAVTENEIYRLLSKQ